MSQFADRSDEHLELTRELWPRVNANSLIPVGDGWTCDTYEVDGRWIVQYPRSAHAEESLRKQAAALPRLAMHISAQIPEPVRPQAAEPVAMLYPRIGGEPFTDAPDGTWPEELGRMLRELHSLAPEEVGIDQVSTSALRVRRAEQLRMMTERVLPLVPEGLRLRLELEFAEHIAKDELWNFEPVLVHDDLGPQHILVDDEGGLAGVIDWEELAPGDPSSDFAWLLFERPDIGRRVVRAAAMERDVGWEERARFLYVLMPFHDVIHGLETKQNLFVELGVRGIQKRAELLG